MNYLDTYQMCYLIRAFEKEVEVRFEQGKMRGTTHGCIGQEIIPTLIMANMDRENDYITGTHRCHGQILAYTGDPYRLACEMMGKKDGFNCGMGGSQHIKVEHYITNGVTGGMASVAMGMALSIKKQKKEGIVISFLGDGGLQEGYVVETMNLASLMKVPIVYVIENNHYAMSTPTMQYSAGSFKRRIEALDIRYYYSEATELEALENTIKKAMTYTRNEKKPVAIEINTFRLCGHSKSDNMAYMTDKEKQDNRENDPVKKIKEKIEDKDLASEIEINIKRKIKSAFDKAETCEQVSYFDYRKHIGII